MDIIIIPCVELGRIPLFAGVLLCPADEPARS